MLTIHRIYSRIYKGKITTLFPNKISNQIRARHKLIPREDVNKRRNNANILAKRIEKESYNII